MPPDESILPTETDGVLILVNPKAGARSARARADRLAELLRERGFATEVLSDLDETTDRANRSHAEGRLRALIGVGGDGTAAELVNRTTAGLPLTILPAGNENLLARHLGLGRRPEAICQAVADGRIVRLDAAKANGRIFLLMIGCGFDGEVVRRVHQRRTGHIRSRNYLKPILQTIRSYRYPELRVYWTDRRAPPDDSSSPSAVVRWLFAFNLPCYGGGLRLAPEADGTDGELDVCAFGRGGWWHTLRYAAGVAVRRHQRMADCTVRRVKRLRIAADVEVPYQLDGDPGGVLPVDVEVLPKRLTIVVPSSGG